jgi:hypothetical protein
MRELFPEATLSRLARIERKHVSTWDSGGAPVRRRHEIITATGPDPWRCGWALHQSWCAYLGAAEATGLLTAAELRANLTGDDDDSFRGAMAECEAVWFFRERLGGVVRPKVDPKDSKNSDFAASLEALEVHCEVKAPCVPRMNNTWAGDDAKILRSCVDAAGSQLKKGRCNIVVLVPTLRIEVFSDRDQLLKAIIGEQALSVFVSLDDSPAPPPKPTFLQKGKLARLHPKKDGSVSTDFTRISAVMSLEHVFVDNDRDETVADHRVVVVHNPFAEVPLPASALAAFPQLVKVEDGAMAWTDRQAGPDDSESTGA